MKKLVILILVIGIIFLGFQNINLEKEEIVEMNKSNENSSELKDNDNKSKYNESNSNQSKILEFNYEIIFNATWNSNDFGKHYTTQAHFSPIVIFTHKIENPVFKVGEKATKGVEDVSETGSINNIIKELNELTKKGIVKNYVIGGLISPAPGTHTLNLNVKQGELLSAISMIAPTPDWFVSVTNIDLFKKEYFSKNKITIEMNSYDAGTEDGNGFSISNPETRPQQTIEILTDIPSEDLPKFAKLIFIKK